MTKTDIIKFCKDLGCCYACCLRFAGLRNPAAYENPQKYVENLLDKISQHPQDSAVDSADNDTMNAGGGGDTSAGQTTDTEKNEHSNADALNVEGNATLLKENVSAVSSAVDSSSGTQSDNTHHSDTEAPESSEPPAKRGRLSQACVCCVGVLQEDTWEQCFQMVKDLLDRKRYECSRFACALSAPLATALRECGVALRLAAAFPGYDAKCAVPLKEAWKWALAPALGARVAMAPDSGATAPLLVTVSMEYGADLQELQVLRALAPALFAARGRQRRRFAAEFTRRSVEQALAGVTLAQLLGAGAGAGAGGLPAVGAALRCAGVSAEHAPLYLGGRYVKLSRALPQTPWLVAGRRMMESSVQELIFQPILDKYMAGVEAGAEAEAPQLKFVSAGREDVDVRCLGEGRPFAIEITDPRRRLTEAELAEVCAAISASEQVRVARLVHVTREALTELKRGEETKCKTYEALCIKLSPSQHELSEQQHELREQQHELREQQHDASAGNEGQNGHTAGAGVAVSARDIANINAYRNTPAADPARVALAQRTPVRVLHRRPLLVRNRRILSLEARTVPGYPCLFALRVRTDAGTYVKEWCHGELGRTRPSLAHALSARADILALDVAAVELQWP